MPISDRFPGAARVTDRTARLRAFYAQCVARRGGAADKRVEAALAAVPREIFAGPGPWSVLVTSLWPGTAGRGDYVQTPDDDPAFLYQDVLVALDAARGINIGEPSLHAHCLDALALRAGETVLHVGAGSGYYTAILAELVGVAGRVHAFEIDPPLAARAAENLADRPTVALHRRSGLGEGLPAADAIYVNAGLTQPSWSWLDALRPEGRLMFPLQPEGGVGGMLLVRRPSAGGLAWPARFVSRAMFIGCQGPQDAQTGRGLAAAFAGGGYQEVRWVRLDDSVDGTCWFRGDGWWLSAETD